LPELLDPYVALKFFIAKTPLFYVFIKLVSILATE
jgi:hypothetical protein